MLCNVELTASSIPQCPLQNILLLLLTASIWGQLQPPSRHGNIAHQNTTYQTADVLAIQDQQRAPSGLGNSFPGVRNP